MKLDEEMKIKIGKYPARTELVLQWDTSDFQLRSWNVVPRMYVYASLVPRPPPQLLSLAVRIMCIRTASDDSCGGGLGTRLRIHMRIIQYARPPPTTSWRVLCTWLVKLNLAKILSQYKGRAIGENFIPQIFCRIRYVCISVTLSFRGRGFCSLVPRLWAT